MLKRAGHTEATIDLARLAGLYPAGVLCEIVNEKKDDMARVPELERFADEHGLLISIADLVATGGRPRSWRAPPRPASPRSGATSPATPTSRSSTASSTCAMVKGTVQGEDDVLVRVHSECLTGDVFGSLRCDCGAARPAMQIIAEEGHGVVVYLRGHEGRGIGIGPQARAYKLQERGPRHRRRQPRPRPAADSREYGIGAQILVDLGITTMRLMTNNPAKRGGLEGFGLEITERVPLLTQPNPENIAYLRTKRERMGHLLEGLDDVL